MNVEEYLKYTESKMAKYFKGIKIVSEANLPYTEYISILENFEKILSRNKERQLPVVNLIWNCAPSTALLLTVNYAIYNYDGNFWGNFKRDISLMKDSNWKTHFLWQIQFENLEVFNKNSNQKYVENILGHAGIPKHNIAGLIKHVIDPAASFDLTAEEVIEAVKKEKNYGSVVKTYGLYKSVKDFLKLNNSVSNSLISRCIEVWREQDRPFTEKYRNYLPDHILDEFEQYASQEVNTKIRQMRQQRVARPILSYSTQFQNVFIMLPIQRFNKKEHMKVDWKIISSEDSIILPTKMYVSDEEQEYIVNKKNGEHPVSPSNDYTVHLLINGEIKGEWSFYLDKVAVFDTGSYEQLNKNYLTASNMLMILHESEYKKIENCKNDFLVRPLFNQWHGYYEIDLYVQKPDILDFSTTTITLNPLRNLMKIEGTRVANAKAETAIYTDQPIIKINSDISSLNIDLSKWSLKLYHPYSKTTIWKKINELEYEQSSKGINVNLLNLFNESSEPFGKYSVSLTGILGHDQSIDFFYVSKKDFSFSVHEQKMTVLTSPNIDFTIPTIFDVEKKSETETLINVPDNPDFVRSNLLNLQTKEKLDFKLYSSLISCEMITMDGTQALGATFNAKDFDFTNTHVLLDLENPSLLNSGKAVAVTLMEKLKTGEFAKKTFNCRVGRKHVLDLKYFDGLHETGGKRTLGMTIGELNISEKVVIVETEWMLDSLSAPSSNDDLLSFDCSFQPEKLKARIWSFNPQRELVVEQDINYPTHSFKLSEEKLPDGYYIFELQEMEEYGFFDIFDEVIYPSLLDNHRKLMKVERKARVPNFVEWLLLLDGEKEEKEWTSTELEKFLKFLWDKKAVIEPLLLKDYNSCCDFGLQNIDFLLEIIKKEENDDFSSFVCKISGYQEWDPDSFNNAMQNRLEKENSKSVFAPEKISLLRTLSRRERAISFQRKIKKSQFIKGFSIHHEYLSFFDKVDNDEFYRSKIEAFYGNHKDALDKVFVSLIDLQLISKENLNRLNTRKMTSNYVLYEFPYYIGLSALACALIIDHESKMDAQTLFALRQAIPALYDVSEEWYLHDLVHWKEKLVTDKKELINLKERKQKYEHPSFTWKE